jgi:hypothetical protein
MTLCKADSGPKEDPKWGRTIEDSYTEHVLELVTHCAIPLIAERDPGALFLVRQAAQVCACIDRTRLDLMVGEADLLAAHSTPTADWSGCQVARAEVKSERAPALAGYHRKAAVCTGASQSAVICSSSRVTVTEQPAISSEVT